MKKVYIILSQTGTVVSSIIRGYTGDPYNHVSIAFDRSLDVMYSFGRKHRYNVLNNGFIEENFSRGLFAVFPNARCLVLELFVTDNQYDTMLEAVDLFLRRRECYRYNMVGLLGYMVGIGLAPKDRYFCSQFVAHVLGRTEVWLGVPELTKPMDFLNIIHKGVIFEGSVKEYKIIHEWTPTTKTWWSPIGATALTYQHLLTKLHGISPSKLWYNVRSISRRVL